MILPVLLLIIMGILYFGRYENYSNQETQLAGQGARLAAVDVNPTTSHQTLQQYVAAQASAELTNGSSDVTSPVKVYIYLLPSGQTPAVRVCVVSTVTYPLLLGVARTTQVMAESAAMRVEYTGAPTNYTADTSWPSQCPSS